MWSQITLGDGRTQIVTTPLSDIMEGGSREGMGMTIGYTRRSSDEVYKSSEVNQANTLKEKSRASALDDLTAKVSDMEEYIGWTASAITSLNTSIIPVGTSKESERVLGIIRNCWRAKVDFHSNTPVGHFVLSFEDAIVPKAIQLDIEMFYGMRDFEIMEHVYQIHVDRFGPFRGRDALLASGKYDNIREVRGNLYIYTKGHDSWMTKYIVSAKAVAGLTTEDALKMKPETLANIGIYSEKEEKELSEDYDDLAYALMEPKISRRSEFADRMKAKANMSKAISSSDNMVEHFNSKTGLWEHGVRKEEPKEETLGESIYKELSEKYLN